MIVLSPIEEIEIVEVYDRGIANQERIMLKVKQTVEIAQFAVVVGLFNPTQPMPIAQPLVDQFFWFGDGVVNAGEYIFVYTGPGTPRKATLAGKPEAVAYVLHWGRTSTLFANSLFVPVILKFGGIQICQPPRDTVQLALPDLNGRKQDVPHA